MYELGWKLIPKAEDFKQHPKAPDDIQDSQLTDDSFKSKDPDTQKLPDDPFEVDRSGLMNPNDSDIDILLPDIKPDYSPRKLYLFQLCMDPNPSLHINIREGDHDQNIIKKFGEETEMTESDDTVILTNHCLGNALDESQSPQAEARISQ